MINSSELRPFARGVRAHTLKSFIITRAYFYFLTDRESARQHAEIPQENAQTEQHARERLDEQIEKSATFDTTCPAPIHILIIMN